MTKKTGSSGGTAILSDGAQRVWTIGHSTKSAEEFLEMLREQQAEYLVDVRSYPGSRRYPHFNREHLCGFLELNQIQYRHMPELGGRRRPKPDSRNSAWNNEGFRGYADYMETEAFQQGIAELLEIAGCQRTAVMCAEAVWWKCHRSLIADYLKVRGIEVLHILSALKTEVHPFTSVARIVDGELSYEGLLAG